MLNISPFTPAKRGFSLVELSIVLVILGLLTGGILAGQSLIRASELRNLSSQLDSLQSAHHTFKDKYLGMPGDLTNAQSFFGAAPSGICANSSSSFSDAVWNSPRTLTCNGNGDGSVSPENGLERFFYFQHLANAGLINGQYSGVWLKGANDLSTACACHNWRTGLNQPQTSFSGVGIAAGYFNSAIFPTNPIYAKNVYVVGRDDRDHNQSGFIKTEELWNLDTKMDDGKPGAGKLVTQSCNSAGWHLNSSATYTLNDATSLCYFMLIIN